MEIITKTEGNKATMEISGWLDTQTAPQLGEALSGLEDSITSLVFDFTNLQSEIINNFTINHISKINSLDNKVLSIFHLQAYVR